MGKNLQVESPQADFKTARQVWDAAKANDGYQAVLSSLESGKKSLVAFQLTHPNDNGITTEINTLGSIIFRFKAAKTAAGLSGEEVNLSSLKSEIDQKVFNIKPEDTYRKNEKNAFFQTFRTDFSTQMGLATPFKPLFGAATFIQPNLTSVYMPGKTTYNIHNMPFIPAFDISAGEFRPSDYFGSFPRPFPRYSGQRPRYAQFSLADADVENFQARRTFLDAEVSGIVNKKDDMDPSKSMKGLAEWLDINYAKLTHYSVEGADSYTRWELDLLFRKEDQTTLGETMVFIDDKKNGAIRAFYNDGKGNWFNSGALYQDGKPVSGSGFEGELNLEEFKASTSYMKSGDDAIFYVVASVPKANLTAFAQRTGEGKSDYVGIWNVTDELGIQAGYFTLDTASFFGAASNNKVRGGSAGVVYNDIFRGKVYAGTEGKSWNVLGVDGRIVGNTFVSGFVRRDEGGKPTNSNIEFSNTLALGPNSKLRTSFRQLLISDGQDKGSGAIELKIGDFTTAFAYDNITNSDYWGVLNDYLKTTQNITTVRQLLDATRNYLNTNVLTSSKYPLAQLEIGQKGFGKIRITGFKDKSGQLSYTYTDPDGQNQTFSLSLKELSKKAKLEDIGFSYVGDKLFFQVDKEKYILGGKIGNTSVNFTQSLVRQGVQLKALYSPKDGSWGFGGVVGSTPIANSTLPNQTFFIGGIAQKSDLLPIWGVDGRDQINLEALVHPNPGVYSFGIHYSAGSGKLNAALGLNFLWMPKPEMDKARPFDRQLTFTIGYRW